MDGEVIDEETATLLQVLEGIHEETCHLNAALQYADAPSNPEFCHRCRDRLVECLRGWLERLERR
jgi:hypothetical protein